jgi:hypothetical protein
VIILLLSMGVFMATEVFAKFSDWTQFNSSLLIEVTRPNGVFTCTGVAMSSEILVTAAHCLEGEVKKVRIFTQQSYDPKQSSLAIDSYEIHPQYNSKKSRFLFDIAKIKLKHKLPKEIRLLPVFEGNLIIGKLYRFGFGGRDEKNIRTVMTPKFRKMNIKDQVLELDDKFSKSGDSGGPIFMQNGQEISLVAIHSTFSHGPEGEYSLNPRLSAFLPWIYLN